jgi:hypothetical protein
VNAEAIVVSGVAEPHHLFGKSAWISFWLRDAADVPSAIPLLRKALDNSRSAIPITRVPPN